MSDREKDDGLVIGILVVLLLFLGGGLGFGGFILARNARARELEARMAVERALIAEEHARAAAAALRAETELQRKSEAEPEREREPEPSLK